MELLLGSTLSLQLREEDDVADAFGSGEHHDEAVDADADAACGGHAVFEGGDEFFVDFLDLFARLFFVDAIDLLQPGDTFLEDGKRFRIEYNIAF